MCLTSWFFTFFIPLTIEQINFVIDIFILRNVAFNFENTKSKKEE